MSRSTSKRARVWALTLCASLSIAGCDAAEPEPGGQDVPYALGGKADSTCPAQEPLCWNTDDIAVMHELMREQDNVLAGHDTKGSLETMLQYAGYLEHKLPNEALDAIADIEMQLEVLPEGNLEVPEVRFSPEGEPQFTEGDYMLSLQILRSIHADVLAQAEGAYFLANSVALGRAVEAHQDAGKADDAELPQQLDPADFGGLSPDMMRSLQLLRDSGFLGQFAVTIYRTTGILEDDYEVVNALNFGELGHDGLIRPSGLSREAKVRHIVNKYLWSSGLLGAGAGLASAIPIAGTAIGVTAEVVWLFKLHAQMTFEIAAVYGWNIREGDNLLKVTHMMVAEGFAIETADIVISNIVLPLVAKRLSRRFGFELADDLARRLASRGLQQMLGYFTRKGQQQLANVALEHGARGIAKGVLTWATLGAAALVSAGLDAASTWYLARQVQLMSKRWVGDLMLEGSSYLADRRHRDCAFRALASIAWADGAIGNEEKALFVAYLSKPYAVDESTWLHLGPQERIAQGRMVGRWNEDDSLRDVERCLTREFQSSDSEHRVSLLGHLYTMLHVDGDESSDELDVYESYRDGLDGSGFFDGSALDLQQLTYVERAVKVTTNPSYVVQAAAQEHRMLTEQVLVGDILEFINRPNPEVLSDFECGLSGERCEG